MAYKTNELAKLSGVSARTLRYYDQLGLLKPSRDDGNGYRLYRQAEVDRLQQILFYRELGVALEDIQTILSAPDYNRRQSLERHLSALLEQKTRIEALIGNVEKTLKVMKGESTMTDKEKFEGFKQSLIKENEAKYGQEVVEKYGEAALREANERVAGMSESQWNEQQALSDEMIRLLKAAMAQNDPASGEAQQAADLHRQWLCRFWKAGAYSKQAHRCLAESYVADPRFAAYYNDKLGEGGAEFLKAAIEVYTK